MLVVGGVLWFVCLWFVLTLLFLTLGCYGGDWWLRCFYGCLGVCLGGAVICVLQLLVVVWFDVDCVNGGCVLCVLDWLFGFPPLVFRVVL